MLQYNTVHIKHIGKCPKEVLGGNFPQRQELCPGQIYQALNDELKQLNFTYVDQIVKVTLSVVEEIVHSGK